MAQDPQVLGVIPRVLGVIPRVLGVGWSPGCNIPLAFIVVAIGPLVAALGQGPSEMPGHLVRRMPVR